jgi:uncharacterized protein YcbK (DUF882 family)
VVLALALCAAPTRADPPVPRFLPPRGTLTAPAPKKDPAATVASPTLRPTAFTAFHTHTLEALAFGPEPEPDEALLLRRLLRDRTNWEEHVVDPRLWAALRACASSLGARRVELVSGYRSDKLNELLRKKGHQVARHSQHTLGGALDFRLAGVPTLSLLRCAQGVHRGGLGYYPASAFIHVDVGPPRRWNGD